MGKEGEGERKATFQLLAALRLRLRSGRDRRSQAGSEVSGVLGPLEDGNAGK